jgi:hypothetical protein
MGYRVDTVPWPIRPFDLEFSVWFSIFITSCAGSLRKSRAKVQAITIDHSMPSFACGTKAGGPISSPSFVIGRLTPRFAIRRRTGMRFIPCSDLWASRGCRWVRQEKEGNKRRGDLRVWFGTVAPLRSRRMALRASATLKKGVLHNAQQSGDPVVPLTFWSSRFISWPSWDSKRLPRLFDRIQVILYEAIDVNNQNFEQAGARIVRP